MAARLIAVALLALGLLPIADWIPGGESDPEYLSRILDWFNGLLLCAAVGVLTWYVSLVAERRAERAPAGPARTRAGATIAWVVTLDEARTRAVIAIAALILYAVVAQLVFSGRPLLIDEIVQVLQARWYADGLIAVPTSEPREFTSILHLVDLGGLTYSQFPAGGPAMLALGALVHAEWLVGPVAGAVSVWLFGRLLREVEPESSLTWRLGATALFAVAPFGVFMFGSHMNHATATLWLLAAALALAFATREGTSPWWGLATGLALGIAATVRPVDGAAFALPAAGWLAWRARRGGPAALTLLLSGAGVALPLAALFWVNARTTGAPLLFGYDQLWGAGHALGFHSSPWGPLHTPARGIELVSLYVTRLAIHLFETPFPAILPAAMGLWFARRLRPLDRYLLVASALLVVAYWAYWHDGYYLGPRFVFPLLPLLVLWSARLPASLASARSWSVPMRRAGVAGAVAGAAYALVFVLFVRVPQYRNGMTSMRTPVEAASTAAGVRDALVLVKESWGARLLVRMWALGISRSDAEVLYRTADACRLELAISSLEAEGARGALARDRLTALQADSSALVKSTRSPDFTERMLPGFVYPPACEAAVAADGEGFSHLAPFRLARDGNVYVRWLPGREAEIAARYPDRAVYLLGRAGTAVDAPLTWTRWDRPLVR
jgi:hypothetical protein